MEDELSLRIAKKIHRYVIDKVGEENVFELIVSVKKVSDDEVEVEAEIDLNPFTGLDPKALLEEALNYALELKGKEFKKVIKGEGGT